MSEDANGFGPIQVQGGGRYVECRLERLS
jgi:hypothetical protein